MDKYNVEIKISQLVLIVSMLVVITLV